jgi:hypothetical protein
MTEKWQISSALAMYKDLVKVLTSMSASKVGPGVVYLGS